VRQNIEHGQGLDLCACDNAPVGDGRRHRDAVRPVVSGAAPNVGRIVQCDGRYGPDYVSDVVGSAPGRLVRSRASASSSAADLGLRNSGILAAKPRSGTFSSRCSPLANVWSASDHCGSPTRLMFSYISSTTGTLTSPPRRRRGRGAVGAFRRFGRQVGRTIGRRGIRVWDSSAIAQPAGSHHEKVGLEYLLHSFPAVLTHPLCRTILSYTGLQPISAFEE
jgi:hypothetical protein